MVCQAELAVACGPRELFLHNICEAEPQITRDMMNYVHISGSGCLRGPLAASESRLVSHSHLTLTTSHS